MPAWKQSRRRLLWRRQIGPCGLERPLAARDYIGKATWWTITDQLLLRTITADGMGHAQWFETSQTGASLRSELDRGKSMYNILAQDALCTLKLYSRENRAWTI